MKLHFLGTAAAESLPATFCECEICKTARARGGREIRSRSQALINNKILIDLPCDTLYHALREGINLSKTDHCIITHTHGDHFYPKELYNLKPGCAYNRNVMQLYGNSSVGETAAGIEASTKGMLKFNKVEPFKPFHIDDIKITALKARHGSTDPYFYMLEDGQSALLYAHDTDIFPEETWEYLRSTGVVFNAVSLDCTEGAHEELSYHGHMCFGRNVICRDRMIEYGLVNSETKFILNHFSHNGLNANYKELCELAAPLGFSISHDGMIINI